MAKIKLAKSPPKGGGLGLGTTIQQAATVDTVGPLLPSLAFAVGAYPRTGGLDVSIPTVTWQREVMMRYQIIGICWNITSPWEEFATIHIFIHIPYKILVSSNVSKHCTSCFIGVSTVRAWRLFSNVPCEDWIEIGCCFWPDFAAVPFGITQKNSLQLTTKVVTLQKTKAFADVLNGINSLEHVFWHPEISAGLNVGSANLKYHGSCTRKKKKHGFKNGWKTCPNSKTFL